MTTLVTGGAGFIGTELVRALAGRGDEVIVVDSFVADVHGTRRNVGTTVIEGEVGDPRVLRRLPATIDNVVHLAALTGVAQSMRESERYIAQNCGAMATMLRQLNRRDDVRAVVLASSRAVYGEGAYVCVEHGAFTPAGRTLRALSASRWDHACPVCGDVATALPATERSQVSPVSVYAATKLLQEHLLSIACQHAQCSSVTLRLFNVIGPGQAPSNPYTGILAAFARHAAAGRPIPVYEDGAMTRDFVDVQDVVRAILAAIDAPYAGGSVFNIGSGRATTLLELATTVATALGAPAPEITREFRIGDVRHAIGDSSRAMQDLGWVATRAIEDSVVGYLEWFLQQAVEPMSEEHSALVAAGLAGVGT